MTLSTEFIPLPLDELRRQASVLKADGWRFIQTHAVNTDNGIDLYYSFMRDGKAVNYRIEGVTPDQPVPSITDLFLAAFVFENEARELFGVDMRDIVLDFQGALYAPAEATPMTFISPEQKAARDKARKVAAAKAAKEATGSEKPQAASAQAGRRIFKMTSELQARLDAKMPTLSEEKKAKVEAALKARAEEAAAAESGAAPATDVASQADAKQAEAQVKEASITPEAPKDAEIEAKLALMDESKAAKVRAALEGRTGDAPANDAIDTAPADVLVDAQIEQMLSQMDPDKASKVLSALNGKEGE